MGVDLRKPPLPAPTESSTVQTSREDVTGTDLATDLSHRTDRTSYSIPEDGSPVTITTQTKRDHKSKDRDTGLTRPSHHSQTSLLIEYFEGGKGPNVHARPSVRVKVTPSSARKAKDTKDHIQITEAGGHRKPSYTRRISLGPHGTGEIRTTESDERSISSYTSAAEDSGLSRRPPVEIEVMHKDQASDLSGRNLVVEHQHHYNASDISSMPPDSMLEENLTTSVPARTRSRSVTQTEAIITTDSLKTPSTGHERGLSRERITQKVIEKLGKDTRAASGGKYKHGSKSRSRSVSKEQMVESIQSPRQRSSRHQAAEELPSGAESSLLTTSQLSDKRRSGDQYSFRSGTSKSSINNPRLLETVEDAIRRLILPELTALKHEQKTQQNRSKFERDRRDSLASGSSVSREELTRRVSKHASAPDVSGRPKVVLNRDENNAGTIISGNSIKGKKDRRLERTYGSPSERTLERGMSEETVVRDGTEVDRKRSKGLKEAAAGALIGGILTHAALKHHDSKSSVERRERRKKRSKSHSRSASIAESTEEIFQKHDVPPMPMRSEITDSDLTRDSILSERTSTPTSERRRTEIRQVVRGSPREVTSPASRTPTRSPGALRGLGAYHSNASLEDIKVRDTSAKNDYIDEKYYHENTGHPLLIGATAAAGALAGEHVLHHTDGHHENAYVHGRGLSPIQSVASDREVSEPLDRASYRHTRSSESISSLDGQDVRYNQFVPLVPSTEFPRSTRPKGISLETGEEVVEQYDGFPDTHHDDDQSADRAMDAWYDQQHEENERYRDSLGNDSYPGDTVDIRHLTNYTDDSMDAPYLDKVTAAQHIRGIGANAEYVHTPLAVESAVASLHDPSVLDVRSSRSGVSRLDERSYLDSPNTDDHEYVEGTTRELNSTGYGSPLKNEFEGRTRDIEETTRSPRGPAASSPRREAARSFEEEIESPVKMTASGLPIAASPIPEIGHGLDSKSDISTNPSIIQGPSGGIGHDNRTHWPYQPTPPQSKGDLLLRSSNNSAHESLKAVAANMLSAAAGAGALAALAQRDRGLKQMVANDNTKELQDQHTTFEDINQQGTTYTHDTQNPYGNGQAIPTPLAANMAKDEGYVSAANPRSTGALTPDYRQKGVGFIHDDDERSIEDKLSVEDPFIGSKSHTRHLSGNSWGAVSPLYDNTTGRGMDRIQSKDVVALMDHLTVRDCQRNARDTEILVTLVRSAAEMRNSFEDMKRFITQQDQMLIGVGDKQHDRTTQKIIGGPRPQPLGTPRVPRRSSADDDMMEDLPAKRRSVFKRALKGLGGRNSNDLARIEDMLLQLLGEMEELKQGKDTRPSAEVTQGNSFNSYERVPEGGPEGYEPEGQAGTSSTGNHSGYFSNPNTSRQTSRQRGHDGVRGSQNRVSTVLEGDEEPETQLELHEQNVLDNQFEHNEQLLTPTRDMPRGGSVPLDTPPVIHQPTGTLSNEHTPKTSTDKSRKHKSSSSSFFPKISRWSKTTASSVADNVRNSGRRERPLSELSRSGSDFNYDLNNHYDAHGDDRIRSNESLEADRPPSPLIPSQVSEKPAYQAHRDSLNLQHPQPRPGPTARYQNHLESQAQTLNSPISPSSDQFGSNPILSRYNPGNGNRLSGGGGALSPISDAGYSEVSSVRGNGPPRPPKIRDDGPLIPPKVAIKENSKPTFAERSAPANEEMFGYEQTNGSPRAASGQLKPTGPRQMTTSGNWSPSQAGIKKTRYRGSPNHIESSSAEDVTF